MKKHNVLFIIFFSLAVFMGLYFGGKHSKYEINKAERLSDEITRWWIKRNNPVPRGDEAVYKLMHLDDKMATEDRQLRDYEYFTKLFNEVPLLTECSVILDSLRDFDGYFNEPNKTYLTYTVYKSNDKLDTLVFTFNRDKGLLTSMKWQGEVKKIGFTKTGFLLKDGDLNMVPSIINLN